MKQHNLFAKNSARHQSIALIAGCLASLAAHGQTVVDSELFPYTLAPYVLENTNLQALGDAGTKAYRPWFENGAWTGDLIQYVITPDGQRTIRNDVGGFPRDGADWRGVIHPDPWSARYAFPDFEPYDLAQETDENWVCEEEDPLYWETRNVWTYSLGQDTRFFWNTISPAQRIALDPGVAALPDTEEDPFSSSTLNFIRGDRSGERCKGGQFRMRFSLLGSIINSRPVYVPPVSDGASTIVVVGANDGMLHGFDVSDGEEIFGYVPSMLMDKLRRHHQQSFKTYFVDGELRHALVDDAVAPRNIVAGGLGAGAKGLFVIDVTTPASPSVVTEISGYDRDFNGGSYEPAIGHIYGRPSIARLPESPKTPAGGWHVVTGNGYDSDSGTAQLALIPVNGGSVQSIPATDPAFPTDADLPNGLSAPALVDSNGDDIADIAYAGDLQGRLWRFDLAESTANVLFDAGSDKPITVEPDVAQHPTLGGYLVYFGTGQLLNSADADDPNYPTQSMYGIWDLNAEFVGPGDLISQTIQTLTVEKTIPTDQTSCSQPPAAETDISTIRIVPDQGAPDWSNGEKGWRVDLPALSGERIVRPAQVRAKRIQFITTNPLDIKERDPEAENIPADAGSWMMQLDLETGANPRLESKHRALFDLNKNCALDDGDAVVFPLLESETQSSYFPIGLNLGPFNIAQPAFARVAFNQVADSAIDGVYINALRLPNDVVTAPPFTGPIDVTTDVPAAKPALWHQYSAEDEGYPGRGDGYYPEPAKVDATGSPQRAFQDGSSPIKPFIAGDGRGNRVNGHAASYNQVHGVNFVDFVNLEPRREEFRLDVGSVFEDTAGNINLINPRKAQQELYRLDEILDMDQSFIVVLANADLSANNEIRIGCRSWPVYEYQTMVMEQLRKNGGLVGAGDDLSGFTDRQNNSLIVKLEDFFELDDDNNRVQQTCDSGELKTLRITPTQRVGADGTLLGTLPGCVNNTHAYSGETKAGADTATREELYAVDPHVTPNQEGSGYRWRNGALTVQLLKVEGNTADFTLQDLEDLPVGADTGKGKGKFVPREGEDLGFGGTYAKGFEWVAGEKQNEIVLSPVDTSFDNGLLYESSIFWHWGDLTRLQSRGVSNPATPACYSGAPPLQFNRELGPWLKQQQYDGMTDGFSEELQRQYAQLLDDIRLGINVESNINLLQELFGTTVGTHANHVFTISDYHKLRIYVPNSPGLDLIPLDQGVTFDSEDAGTPVDVADVERDLLPSLGPNFQPGRRSWIDITPE